MSTNDKIKDLREGVSAALIRYFVKSGHWEERFETINRATGTVDRNFPWPTNLSECDTIELAEAADDENGFVLALSVNGTHNLVYRSEDMSLMTAVMTGMMMED